MNTAAILFAVAAMSSFAGAITTRHVVDPATGLDATVITIPPEENRSFAVLDVPLKIDGDDIQAHWNPSGDALMINGGYFEHDFSPTGLCKVDGKVINKTKSQKLSGFVVVDKLGTLSILTQSDDLSEYPTILQAGPYVIDPGGEIGIESRSGVSARRTLIGMTKDRSVVIVVTEPIFLFDLAQAIKKQFPEVERLLNLDGGPSTAFKTPTVEVVNTWPVRNYIVKRKTQTESLSVRDEFRGQLISPIGSERATSGGGNKIVTYQGKTHVVWQDVTKEGYFNRVRTLDHATGSWSETVTLNQGSDNHARPVLTIDHEGYLHAIMSGHNSPVTHRRSVRPNDSSEWTEPVKVGNGTYPIVACGPDDSLYVTMRSANRWNGVDLYVKRPGEPWKTQCKLVKRREDMTGYAAFHAGLAFGKDGTLHCVVDFYEGKGIYDQRGLHQAVCYLRSRDQGVSWEKSDGTPIELPARPEQLDILARTTEEKRHEPMPPPEVLAQGCIVADAAGVPHVLYISHLDEPGQLIHAWPDDDGTWHRQPIEAAKQAFPDHRATGCRGALTIDVAGTIYALLELQPLGGGWDNGKPTRGMNWNADAKRLVWLISRDRGQTWDVRLALPESTAFNEANVERPTGVNMPAADALPPFIYFDGTSRYPNAGEILQNNVYFVH